MGTQSLDAMLDPTPQSDATDRGTHAQKASERASFRRSGISGATVNGATVNKEALAVIERPILPSSSTQSSAKASPKKSSDSKSSAQRRPLPKNFILKYLDKLYWQRKLRYFYVRFVRLQSNPKALARGLAAGVFAGAFPLLGFQTLIGIMIAALVRGNKMAAAAGTWISNPLTYFPIFALNFHLGRWLLRFPKETVLPSGAAGMDEWMSLGMTATAALMVGALVVGTTAAVVAYYLALLIARVRSARRQK